MSSLTCTKLTAWATAAVLIQSIGLTLFVFGFFPIKPTLSGRSGSESFQAPLRNAVQNQSEKVLTSDQLQKLYQGLSGIPPSYDRLILMVIDGLPAEFLLGKNGEPPPDAYKEAMPYTQSLIENGIAIGYHAKAAPPTVTMPRLKAMMSGAIGGFLDVAFNFNTQALLDDNLIDQLVKIGWKIVMLGDDTWLKLFPGLFTRHDGVSSFFVKDTVQVDLNVSRHLSHELSCDDWNLLILHYLGLDHVGHIGGRNSVQMAPKLSEMDEVIKMIHMSTMKRSQNDHGQTLLVVVSDHGMTDNGNHGGYSYEETDSLALFIGLSNRADKHASPNLDTISQVDIVPTLALLLGVPIPKNNVGMLILEAFDSLTDDQKLRALQLNSWQLLRLLQAQLPGISCANFSSEDSSSYHGFKISECKESEEKLLCCLYQNAASYHNNLKHKEEASAEGYSSTIPAYEAFLKTASQWLSHKTTDKPLNLLAVGVAAVIISCLIFLSLIFCLCKEVDLQKERCKPYVYKRHYLNFDEVFIVCVTLILITSMGSSSMVEEEHYIWHFLSSTVYLLYLRKTLQSSVIKREEHFLSLFKGQNKRFGFHVSSIFTLLVTGRILRGWHQGGVNWTNLPNISKWLKQSGSDYIKLLQLLSIFPYIGLSLYTLSLAGAYRKAVLVLGFTFLTSSFLVLIYVLKYQDMISSFSHNATSLVQIIYAFVGFGIFEAVVLPWVMHFWGYAACSRFDPRVSTSVQVGNKYFMMEVKNSLYLIGWAYISYWSLLQLLLQQQINTVPVLLLFVQILASLYIFSSGISHYKPWVEISALYYMGMAGHFALGNSNTLATIDVAGAFIGISKHSTLLSGILMFIITYASPMLVCLSMVMYIAIKDTICSVTSEDVDSGEYLKNMLGFPCLVPLTVNSILLMAYTILVLLMRNHLFIWSVFSPKYLYACAATVCVDIGVFIVAGTVIHTYLVLTMEKNLWSPFED